ncbi:MAG: type III pantothenate kinase [Thermoleophilia bacterium]|nr:type III pantothenate kinase [Thermoleophilia bacterium]
MTAFLLAIDIGNTHTVAGLYAGERLEEHWRVATDSHDTADQLAAMLSSLLLLRGYEFSDVGLLIVSSVVPSLVGQYQAVARDYLETEALVVGPGLRTGLPVLTNNPHEVGADRIVNAVAALEILGSPCVVVDFGTATTFCAISAAGEYLGGAIAPGVEVSLEALTSRAARLSRVDLGEPEGVIGKTTADSLRSGVVLGFAGLVDGIVKRMQRELGGDAGAESVATIATGGFAELVVPHTETLDRVDPLLTLKGLKLVHERNERN